MTHNQGKSHDVSTKTFQPKTLFPVFNNILTGPHHSTFLHPSLVRAVTVQLGTSVSDRLGIIHVHHKALELSQPSLSCVHLQSVLHSLSPDSFTCLEEKLRDQWRCSWRLALMLPLLQIFLTYLLTGFPPQRQSLEVIFVLLRALDRTWLKGKLPIKWSRVLDLTHHHFQISKEEPHPWELEKGKVIAL